MIKVLYAGSPDASAKTLSLLIENTSGADYSICGVLTNPPSAQGRHGTLIPTPVEAVAREHNIPVFTPEHLDSAARDAVAACGADVLVCFAYGHIFGPKFMSLFKYGGMNLHPSALPKYRGCTPVNAAILNRDEKTAFTVQTLSLKMDEGDILAQKEVSLNGTETTGYLLNQAAVDGAELIAGILKTLSEKGCLPEIRPQAGEASYTGIITKQDALIDWNKSSLEIDAMVRAYNPDPCAWTREGENSLKIMEGIALSEEEGASLGADVSSSCGTVCLFNKAKGILVRCGKGFYAVRMLQRQGKKTMDYKSFMNGVRDFIGSKLQ